MKRPVSISRREVLQLAGRGLLGLGGLLGLAGMARFLGFKPAPPAPKQYEIGMVADYANNSTTVLSTIPALLIHKDGKLRALSLSCPHLGCQVEARPAELVCPCHGSQFDLDGQVRHGPADRALQELRVEITAEGRVILYKAG